MRREIEMFWTQALANLKRAAEESYRHTEE
jgi:hypothetical protein